MRDMKVILQKKKRKQGFKKNVSEMITAYTINHHPRNCPVYIYNFKKINRIIVKSRIHKCTSLRKLEDAAKSSSLRI